MADMSDRRRRLSPEERREQLLDEARDIVERDGVAACTVDAVSQAAGVTPQLVHKYFGTRPSLLQALFQREDERYQVLVHAQIEEADTFEDLVRVFVTANFDQLSRATAIGQLRLAPEVAALRDERRRAGSRRAERVLVRAMAAEYSASPREMEFLLRLGSAASIEAGNLASQRRSGDRTTHIDNTVRFILAGVRELTGPPNGETRPDTAEDSCT
jgi:AcrR family transcriptional regulator